MPSHDPAGHHASDLIAEAPCVSPGTWALGEYSALGASTSRLVDVALMYIEEHLGEVLRVSAICAHCGASRSKLARAFQGEFQTSPTAFILSRRLAGVRRELRLDEANHRRICDIAMDHGFRHLGRFAAAYRAQFGVTPSSDRAASRPLKTVAEE